MKVARGHADSSWEKPLPPPPPTSASYMTAHINHERTLKQPGWLMHTSTMSELVLLSCGSLYSVYFRRILSMSVLAYWNNLLPELKIISAISQSHKILSSYAFFINPNLRLVNVTCIKWNNLNYMIVDDMAVQCFLSIWYSDHPTPKPYKFGVFEKSCQKPGDWDLKPADFHNMCQIKSKRLIIFVTVFFTLLVVSFVLSCRSFGSNGRIMFYYPGQQDGE